MSKRVGPRRVLWWCLAVSAFVVALGAPLAALARAPAAGLDRADKLASVGSLVIGLAGLLLAGVALWVAVRPPGTAVAARDEAALVERLADELADAVRRQWTAEVGLRRLRPRPIRLRWSSTTRPVSPQPSAVLGEGAVPGRPTRLKLRGDLPGMVHAFGRLPARQLVVLGEPGAGKTVLAMLFTLGVLDERAAGGPVPVLLPVSTWDPRADQFGTWLARRLHTDYPALANAAAYGPDAAARLVGRGLLVPVLDGLDEMPTALHQLAIAGLDRAAADRPLVLTCRSAEYEAAVTASGAFLARAAVVEIEPIGVADTITYLADASASGDHRWQPVFEHLRRDPAGHLAQALSTALMAHLARTVYASPRTEPAELCDRGRFAGRTAIEENLIDAYLDGVYAGQPASRPYRPDRSRRWLTYLAAHLHRAGTYDFAWWHLDRAVPRLGFGLVIGVLGGLTASLAVEPLIGPAAAFAFGVPGGIVAGLILSVLRGRFRVRVSRRLKRPVTYLLSGAILGVSSGLVVAAPAAAVVIGLLGGGAEGLVASTVGGYGKWLVNPLAELDSLSPDRAVRIARATAGVQMSAGGLVYAAGGLLGVAVAAAYRPLPPGGVVTLVVGLGVLGGLLLWFDTAWGRFLVARAWFALAGRLPWRLMRFLDDAHRRGVLRQAGAVYQFRHARLQDRLAATDQ